MLRAACCISGGSSWRWRSPGSTLVFRRRQTADSRLAWQILVATVPVGLVGLAFGDFIEANFRNPLFVAGTLSFFGILMYLADRFWGAAGRTSSR